MHMIKHSTIPNSAAGPHRTPAYIGRFAPSPSGPLHFGSLITALASYLDAKSNNGTWLVRMEDIDPPRESPEAAAEILRQLETLGLFWDGEILYQSSRLDDYQSILERFDKAGLCYACDCTRPQIKAMGSVYNGSCRKQTKIPTNKFASRIKTTNKLIEIEDLVQGHYEQNLERDTGDFVLCRKDGLIAYQLAVVADDEFQNISHVIRGFDLLESTPRQIYLQQLLSYQTPEYAHVPIITNEQGQKLSKQHFAKSIEVKNARTIIIAALRHLGQNPPQLSDFSGTEALLKWAETNWDIQAIPKLATISQEFLE
jgi:glutamyl-Q tRNA(Asp) synthetase